MQNSTENLIYKAVVSAVYGVSTLAELMSYYIGLNEEELPEEMNELRKLMEQAQAAIKAFARRWEQHSNYGQAASKSIVVGTFKTTPEVQEIVSRLRETDQ
jgi:hypothetical protein